MKAFYLISYGGSEAVKYGDLPDPVVGNDQLLIFVFPSILVQLVFRKKLTSSNMHSKPEDYEEIEKLFNEKKLKPLIENTEEHLRRLCRHQDKREAQDLKTCD